MTHDAVLLTYVHTIQSVYTDISDRVKHENY